MLEVPDWGWSSWPWYGWGHWSLIHQSLKFQVSILILKVQRPPRPSSPTLRFGGCWSFLTGGWHIDHYLGIASGLWYTNIPNFDPLSWFLRCKEHCCPLNPDKGFLRMLDVPDWGLAYWSWYGYGHEALKHQWSKFWVSVLIFKVQRTSMSFKSSFGPLEDD